MPELIGLSYSPWTHKARWALEHHRISFRYVEHMPMLGEAALRVRLRRPFARVTVPILVTPGGVLSDSLTIAEYAEHNGSGSPLFPAGKRGLIGSFNDRSERALSAGRGLVVLRTGRSEGAKLEALPKFIPAGWRPYFTSMADMGVEFFRRKYNLDEQGEEQRRSVVAAELRAFQESLGTRPYLLDTFSYADIVLAVTLQMVRPVNHPMFKLRPATREAWRDPELEREFSGLLEWRDAIFANHRSPAAGL